MGLVFGWGCFEMECFLTVLKTIGVVVCMLAVLAAGMAGLAFATAATVYLAGIDPKSAWVLAVMAVYFVVGMGTIVGIAECHT